MPWEDDLVTQVDYRTPYVTLGDIGVELQRMKDAGMTRESIEYVIEQVF